MTNEVPYSGEQVTCFVDLLRHELPEHRDNRGKRHSLALVIAAFVLATLVGRQKLSSIYRFMRNRADWLYELTQTPKIKPISRAHLPRLLDGLNWSALNELIDRCFVKRFSYSNTKICTHSFCHLPKLSTMKKRMVVSPLAKANCLTWRP